jgi:hypothetical protein
MPTARLAPLLFCLLLPLPGLAQAPAPFEQPAPPVTPPPLIPAPPSSPDSAQGFPGEPGEDPSESSPQGEIIHRDWYTDSEPSPTAPRLLLEIIGGSVGGAVGIIPGSLLVFSAFVCDSCDNGEETRAILGLGLGLAGLAGGAALGITGAGSLLHGEGEYWPTAGGAAIGTLVGSIVALASANAVGELAIIPFFGGPVVGGMIGYELSHSSAVARRQRNRALTPVVLPVAAVTPRGGVLGGLAGTF